MSEDTLNGGPAFEAFPKIPRLFRECVITEKIDGTNAQILIGEDGSVTAGSRNRIITPQADNFGFARWVEDHKDELLRLGPGRHFGEWWGQGIQRSYGMAEKVFSLFNVTRWVLSEAERPPACCRVVPVLYAGIFDIAHARTILARLRIAGSVAAPGFMKPEGIIVWHDAAQQLFKATIENDDAPKSRVAA